MTSLAVLAQVRGLERDFLIAAGKGTAAVGAFNERYTQLLRELQSLSDRGLLDESTKGLVYSTLAAVLGHARVMRDSVDHLDKVADNLDCDAESSPELPGHGMSASASLPLFDYFLANICFPYPGIVEKERIAEEVRQLGWRDFDKKKVEDWLNRKRNQSGFVTILHQHCGGDRDEMRRLCKVALFGSAQEKTSLPEDAVEDVEDMRDFLQSQREELADEQDSAWMDGLTRGVEAVLSNGSTPSCLSSDDYSSDSPEDDNSECSSTDVGEDEDDEEEADEDEDDEDEDDEDEDDEPPRAVIGAKRKFTDSSLVSPLLFPRPLPRSFSIASSTSSSSTVCSLRSFSGASMSSITTVESEDDTCVRPSKRPRCGSADSEANSSHVTSSPDDSSPVSVDLDSPLFTTYRAKRRRTDDDLGARARALKRSRYAALGVASQRPSVSATCLSTLSSICDLSWELGETETLALETDSFTVDCTQPEESESDNEEFGILLERENAELPEHTPAWSRLHIFSILHMLLSASDRPLPTSLAQSQTYAFDLDPVSAHHVIALEEMMKLSPEALSAMFDAMNGLTPAAAQGVAVSTAVVAPREDALLFCQPSHHDHGVSAPAPNLPAPAVDPPVSAVDVVASAADLSSLSVVTSTRAFEGSPSATEKALSPPEESPSPPEESPSPPEESLSPTSSSSSDSDSPPALSDDSGSSSRSSSVGSDSEQDSLLMSPAALSTEYGRLNDELLYQKEVSQFQVEYGAVPEFTTAAELSCASELLERYLNDQMTWA